MEIGKVLYRLEQYLEEKMYKEALSEVEAPLKNVNDNDSIKDFLLIKIKALIGMEKYKEALLLLDEHFPSPEALSSKNKKKYLINILTHKIHCLWRLGRHFEARDNIEDVMIKINKENRVFTLNDAVVSITDDQLIELLNHRGIIYWYIGDYSNALKNIDECLLLAKEIDNIKRISSSYNNFGLIYQYNLGNLDKALEYFLKAEEYLDREKENNRFARATLLNNIANNYLRRGDYLLAKEKYLESLEIFEELSKFASISLVKSNLGSIYSLLGELDQALEFGLEALKIRRERELKDEYSISLINVGILYYYMAEYDLSEAYLLKSMEINKEINLENRNSESLYWLILLSLERNEISEAEKYLIQLENISQSEFVNQEIIHRYKFVKAIILKKRSNFKDKAEAMKILRELSNQKNITFDLLKDVYLNLSELLLNELTVYKNHETLNELEDILELLSNAAKKQKNTKMFVLVNHLKARLLMFNKKYTAADKLLIYIQKMAEEKGMWRKAISITRDIDKIAEQKKKIEDLDKIKPTLKERLEISQFDDLLLKVIRKEEEDITQLKKYTLDYIHISIFNTNDTTKPIVSEKQNKIEKSKFKEIMAKVGTYYNITLSQGEDISLGLFGPLPVPILTDFMGIAFSYRQTSTKPSDNRENNNDNYFIVFIVPKSLKFLFENREELYLKFEELVSQYTSVDQYDEKFLTKIKLKLIEQQS